MNREERAIAKKLVDAEVRVRTAWRRRTGCHECGGDYDNTTPGCKLCVARHRNREADALRRRLAS